MHYEILISAKPRVNFMPKTPKTYPKSNSKSQRKTKLKKKQPKAQPKPVSIFKSKYYWITLSCNYSCFYFCLRIYQRKSLRKKNCLILGSVLSVIGLAFYIGLNHLQITINEQRSFLLEHQSLALAFGLQWCFLSMQLGF